MPPRPTSRRTRPASRSRAEDEPGHVGGRSSDRGHPRSDNCRSRRPTKRGSRPTRRRGRPGEHAGRPLLGSSDHRGVVCGASHGRPRRARPGARLCDRLTSGRFAALLPLVEFLRSVSAPSQFSSPRLRAAFVIDDPNLHASSYGYLRFDETRRAAREHGFHVAFATVPLDSWLARRSAAAWFKGSELSLLVHGNDHIRRELAHDTTPARAVARLAQAQRRIARLERRSRVGVSRVMAPPHGACSRLTMATLPRVGFEALCISRPYPWLDEPPPDEPLVGSAPSGSRRGSHRPPAAASLGAPRGSPPARIPRQAGDPLRPPHRCRRGARRIDRGRRRRESDWATSPGFHFMRSPARPSRPGAVTRSSRSACPRGARFSRRRPASTSSPFTPPRATYSSSPARDRFGVEGRTTSRRGRH